jgi:4-hydroxythreonine-4-phosphate dehydrogenase
MQKPIIALTMGDPGGIGPEVLAKALQASGAYGRVFFLLLGASEVFEFLEEELRLKLPLNPIPTLHRDFLRDDSVNFLDVAEEARWLLKNRSLEKESGGAIFHIAKVSTENGALALAALKAGAYQAATGLVDALVTAPVNKEAVRLLEPRFQGHTEYLARVARTKEFAMMFLKEKEGDSPPLRVTLVTIHVPLKKVSRLITQEAILEKIRLTDDFLKRRLKIAKPRIGVSALNPHGRETGEEEKEIIEPALAAARRAGIAVLGPVSGDAIFHEASRGAYDALISMYHDQGLAPFKLAAFDTGVNLTLGLPYIRTSPDHGTAFEIAYQGKANPGSMRSAVETAVRLVTAS